ncbi:MAG: OPT super [Sporothrix thermara]
MRPSAEIQAAQPVASMPRHLTLRGLAAGLAVGLIICCSNMYFGLQTGFVSTMSLPSSLLGFGIFKALSRHLSFPFSPVENVLVQTVAGSMAIAPLGRRQVIIREKLKFPSGFGAAVLIGVLHGRKPKIDQGKTPSEFSSLAGEEDVFVSEPLMPERDGSSDAVQATVDDDLAAENEIRRREEWRSNLRLLLVCFLVSGLFTLATYFFPAIRNIPIFGPTAAATWLWTFNPSLAYIGQGVIMGPATTMHMLLGAIIGWAILSPLAKYRGWAPGPIEEWETGSKGWIVWISIAIMLADGIVSLSHVAIRSAIQFWPATHAAIASRLPRGLVRILSQNRNRSGYTAVQSSDDTSEAASVLRKTTWKKTRLQNSKSVQRP